MNRDPSPLHLSPVFSEEVQVNYRDPVCGMPVRPEKAPARSMYHSVAYYFCCAACKQKFDALPQAYASGTEAGEPRG